MRQPARLYEATCPAARWAVGVRRCGGREGRGDRGAAAGRAAETPGVDYSTTNVQEEGVDEPDLVKSNGSTLFVVRSDRLFAVDVRARKPRLAGSLQLPQTGSYELLLHGDRLLVLSHGGAYAIDTARRGRSIRSHTVPLEPDRGRRAATPARCSIVRSLELDADYVSARLVGTIARVVTVSSMPQPLPFKAPANGTPEASAAALAQQPRTCGRVQDRQLATLLQGQGPPRRDAVAPAARAVPQRAPSRRVLRARPADGADDRSPQGARTDRLGLHRRRRPHRVCVAREPLRGDPALVRATGDAPRPTLPGSRPRSTSSTSPIRARRNTAAAAPCRDT